MPSALTLYVTSLPDAAAAGAADEASGRPSAAPRRSAGGSERTLARRPSILRRWPAFSPFGGEASSHSDSMAWPWSGQASEAQAAQAAAAPPAPKPAPIGADGKPKRICCACPETKKARDECFIEKGGESACADAIEAHKACLRKEGFDV